MKDKTPNNQQETKMVARTLKGDAVWSTDGGKMFIMPKGEGMTPLGWRDRITWPKKFSRIRHLPEPHLSYDHVAKANVKAKKLLKALRKGPVFVKNGFIYDRASRMIMTRSVGEVVLHWMDGCGFVFTLEKVGTRIKMDLDVEATAANKVI